MNVDVIINIIMAYFKDKANNEALTNIRKACYELAEIETKPEEEKVAR